MLETSGRGGKNNELDFAFQLSLHNAHGLYFDFNIPECLRTRAAVTFSCSRAISALQRLVPPPSHLLRILHMYFGEGGAGRGNTFTILFHCTLCPSCFSYVGDSSYFFASHVICYLDWSFLQF